MSKLAAKLVSSMLNKIALYFVQVASPMAHRPEVPQELKK